MILWSIVAGAAGVVGTSFVASHLQRAKGEHPPDLFWFLGVVALLPAWLIPFLGLLERLSGRIPDRTVVVWWILLAAAAVGGVIATHARIRALQSSGFPFRPRRYWRIGLVAMAPAWGLAVLGLGVVSLQ